MKKESIITKDIMFVYNKVDAVNDDEVIQECIHYSFVGIQAFLKKIYQCEIAEEFFMQHVHITSTYARTGIDEFLNDLVENHEV